MLASETSTSTTTEPPPADVGAASSKFVPIRPAFRPLLPKPTPTSGSEPTVVIKSHSRPSTKLVKKRKSDAGPLASTIAPSSLLAKRRKSPPASGLDRPRRRNTGDSRASDDDTALSSKEGSMSPTDSKDLLSPVSLTGSLPDSGSISGPSSTLSLSMLSNNNSKDSALYAAAANKVSLTGNSKSRPVLVPASPPSSEQADIKDSDVLLSSTNSLDGFLEPLQNLALDFSHQSALASPTEQFDVLEGINFDDIDVGAFLAPAALPDEADTNGFDPMEIFGPRVDIF